MTLISEETLSKSAGTLYLADLGTGVPAAADLDDAAALEGDGWSSVGWMEETGPTFNGFEPQVTARHGWNTKLPIRRTHDNIEPSIEVPLLQWNAENLQLYFPGAEHDAEAQTVTVPTYGTPIKKQLLLVVADGDKHIGIHVAAVEHRGNASFSFPGDGDLAPIPVAFDVVSTGDPAEYLTFIGIDAAGAGEGS